MSLSQADLALGRLAGAHRLCPRPEPFACFLALEAISSSRIAGVHASLPDVLEAAVTDRSRDEASERTLCCIRALERASFRVERGTPLSLRLVREMHSALTDALRRPGSAPGEFRAGPAWISSPDGRPETARFVPPPVEEMGVALRAWESYVHDDSARLPLLVRYALVHYQFETIHPFDDGNGRLGRLFIALQLMESGILPAPFLGLSGYFARHKKEYYDRLQYVRERGEIEAWLRFFLAAVAHEATAFLERAEQLSGLLARYERELGGHRSRVAEVAGLLVERPVLTVRYVQERLGLSQPGATNLLRRLVEEGIAREEGSGPGTRHRWLGEAVLDILEPAAG